MAAESVALAIFQKKQFDVGITNSEAGTFCG